MHRIAACVEVKDPEQQQNEGLHPPTVQAARDVTQESQPSKHRGPTNSKQRHELTSNSKEAAVHSKHTTNRRRCRQKDRPTREAPSNRQRLPQASPRDEDQKARTQSEQETEGR